MPVALVKCGPKRSVDLVPGNGFEFVNRCLCTYSQWQMCHDTVMERGVADSKKFIYTNVKIDKFDGKNQLYFQSCKTGKSLCCL